MKNLSNIGRIMFAVPFLVFGLMHLMSASQMAGLVPSFIPGGVFWVYLTGLAQVLAAISIMSKKIIKIATLLLGILLMIYVLTIHLPGLGSEDQMMKMMAMSGLLKDFGLAGAAFMISGQHWDE
ncbi:MAG: DoxX family protein [Bacteroidota bacterium]